MVDEELLKILACPLCKTAVTQEDDWLVCTECGRKYPVRDDIPVMLVDEAVVPESAGDEAAGSGQSH